LDFFKNSRYKIGEDAELNVGGNKRRQAQLASHSLLLGFPPAAL